MVLSTAIKGMIRSGKSVTLLSSDTEGFLSDLPIEKVHIPYKFKANNWLRLIQFFLNQWIVFCQILKYRKEPAVIYINTLLPFGAALAGKLTGQKVIYHIHETSIRPLVFKYFLKVMAGLTASQAIYVSKYLMAKEKIKWTPTKVVYNALSKDFVSKAQQFSQQCPKKEYPFTVLMLCSLKKYKGIDQFVALAQQLPQCRFELVLNATTTEINDYFDMNTLPKNLILFPKQKNVHWFYQRAHLVVNLSIPNQWVETFGMTLLEALNYGIPIITPIVGGPKEVVREGINGFAIDSNNIPALVQKIELLEQDTALYHQLSNNAYQSAVDFDIAQFHNKIKEIIGHGVKTPRFKKSIQPYPRRTERVGQGVGL